VRATFLGNACGMTLDLRARRIAGLDLALLSTSHLASDGYSSFLVTLLPVWLRLFGLPYAAAGLLVFLRSAGIALFEPLGGHIADRTSRPFFAASLAVAVLSLSSMGLAANYSGLIVLVVLSTVGQSLFGPQATSAAARTSQRARGLALALFLTGGALGSAIGPVSISAWVAATGIQMTWVASAPGLLICTILFFRYRGVVLASQDPPGPPGPAAKILIGPAVALTCLLLLRGAAETSLVTFLPILVANKGGSQMAVGATVSLFKVAGAATSIAAGHMSDRMDARPAIISGFLLAPLLVYGFLQIEGWMALIVVALLGAALLASTSYAVVVARALLPGRESTAAGLVFSLSILGGGLGALGAGYLADDAGIETALLAAGLTLPLGAAAATWAVRERPNAQKMSIG
jgi:FSR family fosmidomycin resistance protein-like MFS transporter